VSVTLAPEARGRGLAAAVLAAAEEAWRAAAGTAPAVLACVRPGNTASARLFEAAGYRRRDRSAPGGLDAFVKPGR
jgi:ribosomal protein S18 acetylase RimI-like enzyme